MDLYFIRAVGIKIGDRDIEVLYSGVVEFNIHDKHNIIEAVIEQIKPEIKKLDTNNKVNYIDITAFNKIN